MEEIEICEDGLINCQLTDKHKKKKSKKKVHKSRQYLTLLFSDIFIILSLLHFSSAFDNNNFTLTQSVRGGFKRSIVTHFYTKK